MKKQSKSRIVKISILLTITALLILIPSCTDFLTFQEQIGNIQHKVIFDSQEAEVEASPAIKSVKYPATTIDAMPVNPVKTGFAFGGWFTSPNGEGSEFTVSTAVTDTITVYAKWNIDTFTLSYETGTGSKIESATVQNGAKADKPIDPTLEGYTFGGWYTEEDYTTAWDFSVNTVTKDTTLYAKWIIKTYTITFVTNGGTEVSAITVNHGDKAIQSASPTRTGYGFDGWFTDEALTLAFDFTTVTVTSNITLYAKWKLGSYTIQYNLNGGENSLANPLNYTTETETITFSSPSRLGYTFAGWFDNASFNGSAVTTITKGSTGDKALWAKWTANTYTITFNKQSGTGGTDTIEAVYDSAMPAAAAPTRTGYMFTGYYDAISGGTKYYNAEMTTTRNWNKAENAVLYARWTPIEYTITYNTDGGTLSGTYQTTYTVETETITLPVPAKESCIFLGWYTNADLTGDEVKSITNGSIENKEYWVKWVSSYTIVYKANGGSGTMTNQIAGLGIPITLNSNTFTKSEYVFNGWAETEIGNPIYPNKGSFTASVSNAKTLYAKWIPLTMFTCTTSGDTVIIDKYTGTDTVLYIPEEINGKPVVSIANEAFKNCTALTSVTIPSSITSIGNQAFYNCRALTSITIPQGVASLGTYAFGRCTELTSVSIPSSVKSLSGSSFYGCTKLTSVTIAEGVTSIGSNVFYECSSLASVIIPSSVASIGEMAFYSCTGLTSVSIPASVTSIGNNAFVNCKGLTSLTIPEGVASIGNGAFYSCTGLTSVSIPASVTSLGPGAFSNSSNLTSLTVDAGNTAYMSKDNVIYNKDCSTLICCAGSPTSVNIPSSVTSIGDRAFFYCSKLTSVTIPSNLTSIGTYAFYSCSALTSISIPSKVTSIGSFAFYQCTSLSSVKIPEGVTSIEPWAFNGCTNLTSVTIPSSVTSIGNSSFTNCRGLTSISIPSKVTFLGSFAFDDCTSLTSVTIPSGVTSISDWLFYGCSSLTSVNIPPNVTSIGRSAFERSGITSISIPSTVTSIGINAFSSCYSLTSVTIPSNVTSIGSYAFSYCSLLTSITVQKSDPSKISLGDYAFQNNHSTRKIYVPSASVTAYKGTTGWSTYSYYIYGY